jgi:hypothetical protein
VEVEQAEPHAQGVENYKVRRRVTNVVAEQVDAYITGYTDDGEEIIGWVFGVWPSSNACPSRSCAWPRART